MRCTVLGLSIVLALASAGGPPTRGQAIAGPGRGAASANHDITAAGGSLVLPDGGAAIRDSIQRKEYEPSRPDHAVLPGLAGTLQAPNRAQGFRTYFTPSGIEVVPRTEAAPSWTWGLDLTRYGFDGTLLQAGATDPVATGDRV